MAAISNPERERLRFVDEGHAYFLDGRQVPAVSDSREDMRAEIEARFALMAGEFRRLFGILETAFKVSKPDGAVP